jgi:thiamine biosynthesis protein ThiS
MIRISVNGVTREMRDATIASLLMQEGVPEEMCQAVAIARNGTVIPREAWPSVTFENGDTVEIVKPFVGG